jgi:hypothetical protein
VLKKFSVKPGLLFPSQKLIPRFIKNSKFQKYKLPSPASYRLILPFSPLTQGILVIFAIFKAILYFIVRINNGPYPPEMNAKLKLT